MNAPHTVASAFEYTTGPREARTVFVGEAWGAEEQETGKPFAGQSGREFARMLGEAWGAPTLLQAAEEPIRDRWLDQRAQWLHAEGVLLTNVFALRPANNNLAALCTDRAGLPEGYSLSPARTQSPRYIRPEFLGELTRLRQELESARPNLVVALGGTASWALLGSTGIGSIRGAVAISTLVPGMKVLPTYHPAGVLYSWNLRGTVVADFMKAQNERTHSDIRRPPRAIVVQPDMATLDSLVPQIVANAKVLAIDIETMKGQIRCLGVAWERDQALVIPLIRDLSGASYWPDEEQELHAWSHVRALCESSLPKLFQNGLFDLQYLTRAGITVRNCSHDTMLLHHVMYPELPKGLGFLGSIYTNEQAWKLLRKHGEELKRDE